MNSPKKAKPSDDQPFVAVPSLTNAEKTFYGFIDKNPLYSDNTIDAILEFILESRKRQANYVTHSDEDHDNGSPYFKTSRLFQRYK